MIDSLKNDAAGKLVLRCTIGVLMLFHGVAKLMNPGSLDFIGGLLSFHGLPGFITWGVFVGELLAPLLLILGVFSRVGGLFIFVNMLFAIMLAHTGDLFTLSEHGGWRLELQAFYLFGGLAVLLLGSGKMAIRPD
jgi:putative oxidoreductase